MLKTYSKHNPLYYETLACSMLCSPVNFFFVHRVLFGLVIVAWFLWFRAPEVRYDTASRTTTRTKGPFTLRKNELCSVHILVWYKNYTFMTCLGYCSLIVYPKLNEMYVTPSTVSKRLNLHFNETQQRLESSFL